MGPALAVVAGYLAGSLPFGHWVARAFAGVDIRKRGSGNIGASNVWREVGPRYGLTVALLDALKGFVPALVATIELGHLWGIAAGAAAMLGHSRPLFLRFARGGKMVATCGGAFFGVAPLVGGIGVAVWIVVFALTRYASLASIAAAISLPLAAVALGEAWPVTAFAALAALAVLVLHRENMRRLRAGTEHRIRLRRGKDQPARA
ncbi:MAG: glycerol-3-phosphate 1-O-acyltransferase PlsY [Actinomycetota bacterium]|nr:glycerol-3-phosphate 1-O-acyltransferase PlsY [Actinomycetota bacterium]